MPTPASGRVQEHRAALRAAGLRPIQIWVPDTSRPGFTEECRRQAAVVAQADAADRGLATLLDAIHADLERSDE